MDKFDNLIKSNQSEYNPSDKFVDNTMQKINLNNKHRVFKWRMWIPAIGGVVAILAIVLVLPILTKPNTVSFNLAHANTTLHTSASSNNATQSTPANSSATNSQVASSGTDNASLNNDLNSINTSLAQENNDFNSANQALNDSSQEISIPTN